ncbi:hypothetical protein, partial [Xanthomonas perforans]|uniref:hypothetical protein n=1 Tax=Xanthomonas perforans TaxID=442694 RepID=UPI0019D29830
DDGGRSQESVKNSLLTASYPTFGFFLHESLPALIQLQLAVNAINTLVVRLEPFDLRRRMK